MFINFTLILMNATNKQSQKIQSQISSIFVKYSDDIGSGIIPRMLFLKPLTPIYLLGCNRRDLPFLFFLYFIFFIIVFIQNVMLFFALYYVAFRCCLACVIFDLSLGLRCIK